MTNLECLIRIFEEIDDDRMSKMVPLLLKYSINHLEEQNKCNVQVRLHKIKLLYFIQTLYKTLEWAIGIDQQVIDAAV